ncbi:MAG: hypothetical protein MRY74_02215 [Neomegalonema sp.]|nr:hypothetical protein [Neomegalonema sp.]
MFRRGRAKAVLGHDLPEPRVTATGRALMVLYVGLPVLAVLILLDLFVWAAMKTAFGVCFGLWCAF